MRTLLCLLLALLPLATQTKYEMGHYVVGFLRKGPAWIAEETAGKLVVAGPFEDNVDLRGMFIVNVSSVEEVRAMAEADPAIQSHRLVLELHPWFAGKGFKVVQ